MTTYKFSTIEENGAFDFGSYSTKEKISNEEALIKYNEMRKIQSIKGFKRPMPIEVKICL